MNDDLQKPFTREEVEIALRQMGPYKSLGPDGYNACFYQVCWSTVGEDSEAALDFLNGGKMNNELNFTYVAFIPKCADLKR